MPTRSQYDYLLLRRIVNTKLHGRISSVESASDTGTDTNVIRDAINSAVRTVLSDISWRGLIREQQLTPLLTDSHYEYALPADVLSADIIDLRPQVSDCRGWFEEYELVSPKEFDRRKIYDKGIATIINNELTRTLRIASDIGGLSATVSTMEDTNWGTFDSVSVNDSDVKVDCNDYTQGRGAVRFQTDTTDSTDTTIGIQNTSITAFDISRYLGGGHAFVDARITTYDTGIHQISLRIGSDSDNYYQINDSNQADCSAFQTGWNKIRFNFADKTTTGTPTDTAIDYVALFWSRDTTTTALLHLNDTDWGFDNLKVTRGKQYLISYYSRYPWQDTAFALSENSTHDSHALMLQNDEIELITNKAAEQLSQYLRDDKDRNYYVTEYERLRSSYLMKNPQQSGTQTQTYYDFGSLDATRLTRDSDS